MAILTNSGRIAMATSVKAQAIHLAWGSGSAAWDTTPVPRYCYAPSPTQPNQPATAGFFTPKERPA